MHSLLEVVIPPVDNVHAEISKIMKPFEEDAHDSNFEKWENNPTTDSSEAWTDGFDAGSDRDGWWDFWVIGGRFSGSKLKSRLSPQKLSEFREELTKMKVTVHGMIFGKQSLNPTSQIEAVDALWREYFPFVGDHCPLFSHARDQYDSKGASDDICRISELAEEYQADKVLIADIDESKWRTKYLVLKTFWNGINWQDAAWDGRVKPLLEEMLDKSAKNEYPMIRTTNEWLCISVDCHS